MTQVFISYSRKDIAFIKQLADDLKIAGLDVWYDLSGLEGGVLWRPAIEKAIGASQYMIVVLSPDSIVSTWVEEEILYARSLERKIIPLLYKPCKIPLGLNRLNFINVQGENYQQNYKEILRALDIERSKREAAEKARQEARKAALIKFFSSISFILRQLFFDSKAIFRFIGIIAMIVILFWLSFWGFPKLASFAPTAEASLTYTFSPTQTFTNSPRPPTKTLTPKPISTKTQTPVPTPLPTEITDAKGVSMMLVPAGEFSMGSDFGYLDERPVHTVSLDAYFIDKFEVTNELYKKCVEAGVCQTPKRTNSNTRLSYYDNSEFDNYPVIYVTWNMAKNYCEWRESRLPTEAEWEKAARGTNNSGYSWEGCGNVNYDNCVNDTTEVGKHKGNTYGLYDMAGNVWEWVNSLYRSYPYVANDGREETNISGGRTIRGGSWGNNIADIRASVRKLISPTTNNNSIGFRCAKDAP